MLHCVRLLAAKHLVSVLIDILVALFNPTKRRQFLLAEHRGRAPSHCGSEDFLICQHCLDVLFKVVAALTLERLRRTARPYHLGHLQLLRIF